MLRRMLGVVGLVLLIAHGQAQILSREVRQTIIEAVVQVVPWDPVASDLAPWSGSATIISPDGYLLTNFHVVGVEDTREAYREHAIFVTRLGFTDRAPELRYWAEYVDGDPAFDLAILKIREHGDGTPIAADQTFPAVAVGTTADLLPGDPITVVGYPGISGETITFTAGVISGWVGEDFISGGKQWLKTDAKIARGNSGGGAFNDRGELIGVPTVGISELTGQLYEEQLFIRPVSLAWSLIGPNVPAVVRAEASNSAVDSDAGAAMQSGSYGALVLGATTHSTIVARPDPRTLSYHTYTVEVPEGTAELSIQVTSDDDINLAVKFGSEILGYAQPEEGGDADYLDFGPGRSPSYTYEEPRVGTIFIDIVNPLERPAGYAVVATAVPAAEPLGAATIGPIVPGQRVGGSLIASPDEANFHTYTLDVAPDNSQLTITLKADTDLDLAAKYGSAILNYQNPDDGGDADYIDKSTANTTVLVIPQPRAGRWYIDVFEILPNADPHAYTLEVTVP